MPIIKEVLDWELEQKGKDIEAECAGLSDPELLKKEMKTAAKNLDFERAAEIRDLIKKGKNAI